jgi:hypothetical protein
MRKKSLLFFICLTILATSFGYGEQEYGEQEQVKQANKLFLIKQNGKYGYINRAGKVIIEPQFDLADEFSEGLARIGIAGNFGYIDEAGKIVEGCA